MSHYYCDSCQRSAGTLVAMWFSIPESTQTIQAAECRSDDGIQILKPRNKRVCKFTPLLTLSFSDSPVDKCSTCGTCLFFHGANSPEFIDTTLVSVSVKNLSNYFKITAHIWLENSKDQTLRSKGEGLGLAAVINDGLPRWKRCGGSLGLNFTSGICLCTDLLSPSEFHDTLFSPHG